jgi:hypothetical protein
MKYPPASLTPFFASLPSIRRRMHILSEPREPKDLNQLSANATTACSLFALSLQRFRPLACLFSTACSLFSKNTRVGGYGHLFCGRDLLNALSPLPPITSLQPLQFHAITHSFEQRRPAKPCPLKSLHTLSITTGVAPPRCSGFSLEVSSVGQRCYLQ